MRVLLFKSILFLSFISNISFAQTIRDIEGHEYTTRRIGNQTWTTQNLIVSKFKNGDAIIFAKNKSEWVNANKNKTPACCCFKFDNANCEKYGMLYNWYAAVDSRGLAPEGWRVPSDEDFTRLTNYLGGRSIAGHKLKSKKGWYYNSSGINGSNSSKFNGSATGDVSEIGWFYAENQMAYYWSTTPGPSNNAFGLGLWRHSKTSRRPLYPQGYGFAIRCIKN